MPYRSFYAKLSLILTGLFLIIGVLALAVTVYTTRMYQEEVSQKLNRELAQHIVAEKRLIRDNLVNQAALEEVFHMLMVINPSIELYLLSPDGAILAYSAAHDKIRRQRVDLAPIAAWSQGDVKIPLLGDDPRDPQRKKAFSAAPIEGANGLEGYLYIILIGEGYDSVAQMLGESYILRAGVWLIVGGIVLAAIVGMILFAWLTGKLQRLARAMEAFKRGEIPRWHAVPDRGDEIDRLTSTFQTMAHKIHQQTQALERTDRARRDMVADVSHDLRTPLATLQGYLETLMMKDESLSPAERREYLDIAMRHSHHLNQLVGELLELARLDALDTPVRCEAFSLPELAQDIVQKYRLRARKEGKDVDVLLKSDLPFVNADIALIERVLENLIENALRHTPARGRVEVALEGHGKTVEVQVRDTGCGIPEAELPRIFDRFYQIDKSRNGRSGSAGLGLSIAKRILELHGSTIGVHSAVALGTTFAFELPARVAT